MDHTNLESKPLSTGNRESKVSSSSSYSTQENSQRLKRQSAQAAALKTQRLYGVVDFDAIEIEDEDEGPNEVKNGHKHGTPPEDRGKRKNGKKQNGASSRQPSSKAKPTGKLPQSGKLASPGKLGASPVLEEPGSKRTKTAVSDQHFHLESQPHDIRHLINNRHKHTSGGDTSAQFVEPQLAVPQPSYSGLPLEAMPSAKVKKDSLWPSRNKKSKNSNSRDREVVVIDDDDFEGVEKKYTQKLQTNKTEKLARASEIRKPAGPKQVKDPSRPTKESSKKHRAKLPAARANPEQMDINLNTPKLGSDTKNPPASPLRSSKRVKVISPKKSKNTTKLAPTTVEGSNEPETDSQEESTNDDFCSACGGSGVFICCETCPKSFHFVCCDPPLDSLPEDNWNCRECLAKKGLKINRQWDSIGIFGQLLNQTERINPVEFQLPKKLRDNTFIDVTTDEHGTYDDLSLKPELSYSKSNGSQLPGYNYDYNLEIEKLYDKNGNPYLCHKCGSSGLNRRILIHCDYCPLVWHIDCLKEPFYTPKTIGTKWRCPNHYENLLPMNLFVKRSFKDTPILDASLHSHFLKIAQNQNLLIKYRDQPWLKKNGKLATFQEYLAYEVDNFNKMNPEYNDESMKINNTNTLDNDDDIHESFKVPEFFNNFPITSSIVGKPNSNLSKIITMTDETNDNQLNSFVYRVPEELILLDFITKVEKINPQLQSKLKSTRSSLNSRIRSTPGTSSSSIKNAIFNDINLYEEKNKKEVIEQESFLENVTYFRQNEYNQGPSSNPNLKLRDLITVALNEDLNIKQEPQEFIANGKEETIHNEETEDLLAIKKLIQAKGKDALLKFLHSNT